MAQHPFHRREGRDVCSRGPPLGEQAWGKEKGPCSRGSRGLSPFPISLLPRQKAGDWEGGGSTRDLDKRRETQWRKQGEAEEREDKKKGIKRK